VTCCRQSLEEPLERFARRATCAANLDRFEFDAAATALHPAIDARHVRTSASASVGELGRNVGQGDESLASRINHASPLLIGACVSRLLHSAAVSSQFLPSCPTTFCGSVGNPRKSFAIPSETQFWLFHVLSNGPYRWGLFQIRRPLVRWRRENASADRGNTSLFRLLLVPQAKCSVDSLNVLLHE